LNDFRAMLCEVDIEDLSVEATDGGKEPNTFSISEPLDHQQDSRG
jgi:hypothetical protein